ncbi:TPA: histidine kinase [Clostridium perfringens]|uniref:Histidine kinase n=1 Tax=Clostridium perfringens TaxID=1502 RepID=A0AAW9K8Z0_CLOPF|nr:histidine kinase [Clostridium perfringens]MDK0616152.1 histidine kinase [Clostridium perfringens]MDZ4949189.1 histidine kinase [Clostridium perfringens]MDZ7542186.1 histidine kinase [Clostridium perfringens]
MGEKILITKKELAERWGVTTKHIDDLRRQGILQTVKGIPTVRFNIQYIKELEETKVEKYSPIEFRRIERELKEAREELRVLKEILININIESNKALKIIIN